MSGLPAKEIHICGSGIAVDVVKRVVESVGEQIEVKHYDRLLPLVTLNNSLGKHGWPCIQEEHNKAAFIINFTEQVSIFRTVCLILKQRLHFVQNVLSFQNMFLFQHVILFPL